jgi:hypothetical protein
MEWWRQQQQQQHCLNLNGNTFIHLRHHSTLSHPLSATQLQQHYGSSRCRVALLDRASGAGGEAT